MSLLEAGFGEVRRRMLSSRHAIAQRGDRERLLIVNGHPDPRPERFCAALCQACLAGAAAAGRSVDIIALSAIFSEAGQDGSTELTRALDLLRRSTRLIAIFPLWLDNPPEIVTRFFELAELGGASGAGGRHAHIVVTMSLPAFARRSILRGQDGNRRIRHAVSLPGVQVDALNFIGSVDTISRTQREEWLHQLRRLGGGNS